MDFHCRVIFCALTGVNLLALRALSKIAIFLCFLFFLSFYFRYIDYLQKRDTYNSTIILLQLTNMLINILTLRLLPYKIFNKKLQQQQMNS